MSTTKCDWDEATARKAVEIVDSLIDPEKLDEHALIHARDTLANYFGLQPHE